MPSSRCSGEAQAPKNVPALRRRLAELESLVLALGRELSEQQLIPPCTTPDQVLTEISKACRS